MKLPADERHWRAARRSVWVAAGDIDFLLCLDLKRLWQSHGHFPIEADKIYCAFAVCFS